MDIDAVRTEYRVNLENHELLAILDADNIMNKPALVTRLQDVEGVSRVDYDGHCGPHVFFTGSA